MKRSLKILTLVLSLALICGALVVAAFAGDTELTGIAVKRSTDFTKATFTDNTTGNVDTGYFKWSNYTIGVYGLRSDANGNKYFSWNGEIQEGQIGADGKVANNGGFNTYMSVAVDSIGWSNYAT